MRAQRTLIAVHAHPDDECIGTGGILARYAAEGVRTVLVTCTDGAVGEISDPALATPENLAEVRARELGESVRILRVSRLVKFGYRDSGMAGTPDNMHPASFHQAPFDKAVERAVTVMREERPQVVVTYDERGGYGHPDHVRAHQVAVAPQGGAELLRGAAIPTGDAQAHVALAAARQLAQTAHVAPRTTRSVCNHFRPRRHRLCARCYRQIMTERFEPWREIARLEAAS